MVLRQGYGKCSLVRPEWLFVVLILYDFYDFMTNRFRNFSNWGSIKPVKIGIRCKCLNTDDVHYVVNHIIWILCMLCMENNVN